MPFLLFLSTALLANTQNVWAVQSEARLTDKRRAQIEDYFKTNNIANPIALQSWSSKKLLPLNGEILEDSEARALQLKADLADAEFDDENAKSLRQDLGLRVEASSVVNPTLDFFWHTNLFNQAVVQLREGQNKVARQSLRELLRRFPGILAQQKLPPRMSEELKTVQRSLELEPKHSVHIIFDRPGPLHIDGYQRGIALEHHLQLNSGSYRLRLRSPTVQRARDFKIRSQNSSTLFIALNGLDSWTAPSEVRCIQDCRAALAGLRRTLSIPNFWHFDFRDPTRLTVRRVSADGFKKELLQNLSRVPIKIHTIPKFSALYLLPLGTGQFRQRQYAWGGFYLLSQLGFGAVAAYSNLRANGLNTRDQQELSAGLLAEAKLQQGTIFPLSIALLSASALAGITHALIYGAKNGTPPVDESH